MMSRKKMGGKSSGGAQYFTTTKKGEIPEWRQQLRSMDQNGKKEAVKKIIAAMTVGKDVSGLFPDVLQCIQTEDLELKKLVYLYLINYSKSNTDLALLAVNTFVRDSEDRNPLIRALAVRTMGCIRVERITEYLCDPLRRALKDDDAYVRKTAAVCVAKLFDINAYLVEEQGFLDTLRSLIGDTNPTVVANAVASLAEIAESSGRDQLRFSTAVLQKLLAALNECTEWGQIYILDSLAKYTPQDGREADSIVDRITPRLQHANSAVVLSASKVIMQYMDLIEDADRVQALGRKLAPPLVTLLSSPSPELQYVALRNISLVVQKRPEILSGEVKVFFCKYNDPIYVKMEKLDIMIKLATERNVEPVLLELKEYATEVDVEFVRKAVRAIGRCAIKIERAAEKCINALLELIQNKVNYVVQEAIVVIKDIFRKYPNRYESIIATLCENLDSLDEAEAKASMIWIIGEYASRISNSDELLEAFVESFHDEPAEVQLQLLTAVVKLFLHRPDTAQELVQTVLRKATEDSDNPDLRDRGYVYWRLLSTDPEAARRIVLAEKPAITSDADRLHPDLLDELIGEMSSLASVYHKAPATFVKKRTLGGALDDDEEEDSDDDSEEEEEDSEGEEEGASEEGAAVADSSSGPTDLLDFGDGAGAGAGAGGASAGADDLLGLDFGGPSAQGGAASQIPFVSVADSTKGNGLRFDATFTRSNGTIQFHLRATNESIPEPCQQFAVQFNKNTFGLSPTATALSLDSPAGLGLSSTGSVSVELKRDRVSGPPPKLEVQVAVKNVTTGHVAYFVVPLPFDAIFQEGAGLEPAAYGQQWKGLGEGAQKVFKVEQLSTQDAAEVQAKLAAHNIFFSTAKAAGDRTTSYFTFKTETGLQVFAELTIKPGFDFAKLAVRSKSPGVAPFVHTCMQDILRA